MLNNETINKLIGVDESFHASYKLSEMLGHEERKNKLFNNFLECEKDLTYDWFLEYYQSEHSDRKGKMQDFTPGEVAEIANIILGSSKSSMDMCSGVGGLTIKRWVDNPKQIFHCEEFSDRALPFLLFNLSIRNIEGIVRHGDSLSRQFKAIYKLSKGEQFSSIEKTSQDVEIKAETVVMNPPYSMKWEHKEKYLEERRFKDFEKLAPKSKADYAFLLTGLDQLADGGKMAIILPHGVLFRASAEGTIRENLIKNNLIESIIGLPANLFFNTSIPTVILTLAKNKKTTDVFFIDASDEFEKVGPNNRLRDKDINKILTTYHKSKEIERYSKSITQDEIKENDYNLNIPRYIDKFIEEEVPSLGEVLEELKEIDKEIESASKEFIGMVKELEDSTAEGNQELKEFLKYFGADEAITKVEEDRKVMERGQISFYD